MIKEHRTQSCLGPIKREGLRQGKLGSAKVVEFSVFGQGQGARGGSSVRHPTWRRRQGSSPRAISLAPRSLANIWDGYQETQAASLARRLPLYFSLQIEKQNRHQGYIYITVFKLHFYSHLLHMISFKCFLIKKKKKKKNQRAGRVEGSMGVRECA
jgi:hypothetical protein